MKKLFGKGLIALTIASVMMSSVYAVGNGAMIDVKKKFGTDYFDNAKFLAGTDGNGTNTNAFIKNIKGVEAVVNVRTASKNMMPLFDSDFQASSNSIKNSFMPFKDDDRDNMLRSNFGSMSAILAIPKVDSMPLVFAGAQVKGGDMKFGNNMKPGHNMLNIPLVSINAKSLGAQTGTSIWPTNMNNNNVIAFKRKDLTKSGIRNPFIKHLSLANVGSSKKSLFGNTLNIIPLSKHTGDNLAFFVLNEGNIFTPSLGENNMNMKKTGLGPDYVLGNNIFTSSLGENNMKKTGLGSNYVLGNTAGISCAGLVNKVNNSDPYFSNCISNNLAIKKIILNPIGDSGANNFAILEGV